MTEPTALPPTLVNLIPGLARALGALDEDHHLIIDIVDSPRYVQFATFGPNLRAETIGQRYLEACGDRHDDEDLAWLRAHGWDDPDQGGNHFHEWTPSQPLAAATAAVVTLHTVHGVTSARQLEFSSGDPAVLDLLGLT